MAIQAQGSLWVEEAPVLLIVGDPAVQEEIELQLHAELGSSPAVHCLASAEQLETLAEGERYSLCVVEGDPEVNCADTLGAVRRRLPECPILLLLGMNDEHLAAEATRLGVDDYIIRTPEYELRLRAKVSELIHSPGGSRTAVHSLQASARQFQELVENAAQGILVQVEGRVVYVNAALARILGYDSPDELLSLGSIYEFVDARERRRVAGFARRRAAGGPAPDVYVFRARRRDGALIWLENRVTVMTWQERPAVLCTLADVSERQRAANALRLAPSVARKAGEQDDLLEAIRVALRWLARGLGWQFAESWLPSRDGEVLEPGPTWSSDGERFERFIQGSAGQRFERGQGLPGRVWAEGRPDWIEDVSNAPQAYRRSILANEAGLGAGCGIPVTAHGHTVAVLCFYLSAPQARSRELLAALDAGVASLGPVLLRIQAEQARRAGIQQLESLISENLDGILVVDQQDEVLFANPAAEEAFGRRLEELRGMPFGAPSLDSGVAEIEIHDARTGCARINEMRVAEIDWDGRRARLVSLRDVTERMEARKALQERVKELNCVYKVSVLLARRDLEWRSILQEIAEAIPGGWRNPQATYARLSVGDIRVLSPGFRETALRMASEIVVDDIASGLLEVFSAEVVADRDTDPFLDEERALIDELARRIGQAMSTRRYQQELDTSRQKFQDFAEAASDWLWEMDEDLRFTYFSDRFSSVMGQSPEYWIGKTRREIVAAEEHVDNNPKWTAHLADLEAHRPFRNFRYLTTLPDGGTMHVAVSGLPLFDDGGTFRGYRGTGTDETAQMEARIQAEEADRRLKNIADHLPGVVFQRLRRSDGTIEHPYLSAGTEAMFGCTAEEIQQDPLLWTDCIDADDRPRFDVALADSGRTLEPMNIKFRMRARSGETLWVWHRSQPRRLENNDTVWDCIELDISEQKQAEARAQYLGYYDQLTGLPNRDLFVERVNQVLPIAARNGQSVAVAMLGLKRFKQVNEEFGMAGGDQMLRAAAERFRGSLRPGDTVARLGGDRFLILLPSVSESADTHKPLDRLVKAMDEPFEVNKKQIMLSFNMGIALFPDNGDSIEELIQKADTAQAHYNQWGPGFGYTFYRDKMPKSSASRLALEKELRDAIASQDQLKTFFQPIYHGETGGLIAVEALARWMHPQRGLVPPAEFIHLAEDTGLINSVGLEILRQACDCVRQWELSGLPRVLLAVNLSARQIRDKTLTTSIRGILEETGMPAERLILEVTESALIADLDRATEVMEALGSLGVRFALDDFGVGYSSLSYLTRLPVQALKIDRSFIRELPGDPRSETTIRGIVALAHALGLHVVAEGIETPEQLARVKQLGCDALQGFLFAKPMPAGDLQALLAEETTRRKAARGGG